MFSHRLEQKRRIVAVLDLAIVAGAFLLAWEGRVLLATAAGERLPPLQRAISGGDLLPFVLLLWIVAFRVTRYHADIFVRRSFSRRVGRILQTNLVGFLLLSVFLFLTRRPHTSRALIALFLSFSTVGLLAGRLLAEGLARRVSRREGLRRLLVFGGDRHARQFVRMVNSRRELGAEVVGIVHERSGHAERILEGTRVLGGPRELGGILDHEVVDEVVFAVDRSSLGQIEDAIWTCEAAGVRATIVADFFDLRIARPRMDEIGGIPLISFETTVASEGQALVKRAIDLAVAGVATIALLPVLGACALAVLLDDGGPVLYRQVRCGLQGRRFSIWKFRSMVRGAEGMLPALLEQNERDGPVFKMDRDPRMTRVGRWLRMTSLDELPQLFNVLRGEMSLVGPRPPIPEEVRSYERWQRRRLSVKPGITGPWQVSARNGHSFEEWMRMDLDYIDRWSLSLDLKILLRTIPAVLAGTGR